VSGPVAALLGDGRRLHLQYGPIDLIVEAFGAQDEVARAYAQAQAAFPEILPGLVAELGILRQAVTPQTTVAGVIAQRMVTAVSQYFPEFITPMAAVAGAVADDMLGHLIAGRDLRRAYVNNGGDIAFHLTEGTQFDIGVVTRDAARVPDASAVVTHERRCRGIATSGRGGRSFSLGIADAVTVLALDAASADAAATIIGNAVNLDHPGIRRAPASSLDPDSDLGERLVTVAVDTLPWSMVADALDRGTKVAASLLQDGLIDGACLSLQGVSQITGRFDRRITKERAA
jgi:ApbE superfamily uncharacterized protein (UPF0280 family)